jgi:adenylate cyclase
LRKGLKFPPFPKFANVLVETSFPTILLYTLLPVFPGGAALGLPPVFIYFLFIILSALRLEPVLSVLTGLVAAAGYLGLAFGSLPELRHWPAGADGWAWWAGFAPHLSKTVILLIAGGMAGFVAGQIRQRLVGLIRSREERNQIAGIFGQHVSPAVMDRLLHQGEGLDSETREVCVMFLDIRDFTAFAHSRTPDEVVRHLNKLFGFMIEIVNDNHGLINKFLGDGFMAVFGAPLPDGEAAANAIRASLAIARRLEQALAEGQVEPTRIGIGLHSGPAVTGNVGSVLRKEYTVIGDVVNLASRLEQLNKQFASQILVSGETWEAARPALAAMAAEDLGEQVVKGRQTPVRVVRLL